MREKRPWTAEHDAFVRAHPDMTSTEIGEMIGHFGVTVGRHARALGVDLARGQPKPYTRKKRGPRAAKKLDFSAMALWGVSGLLKGERRCQDM